MTKKRTRCIHVRVSPEESAAIMRRSAAAGLTKSEYVRRAALQAHDDRVFYEVDVDILHKIYRALRISGGNVNQLARWSHSRIQNPAEIEAAIAPALASLSRAAADVSDFIAEIHSSI